MSKYGYVGKESDIPQQAFKANAGVLSVNDHLALSQENKLTQYGQLELIETQTITSSTASMIFSSIKEDEYNVIKSIGSYLKSQIVGICVEINYTKTYKNMKSKEQVNRLLRKNKFYVYKKFNINPYVSADYLYIREDRRKKKRIELIKKIYDKYLD